ncbi:hypothetical protein BDV12DRAFT_54799 [Aspergillus spectabilis]
MGITMNTTTTIARVRRPESCLDSKCAVKLVVLCLSPPDGRPMNHFAHPDNLHSPSDCGGSTTCQKYLYDAFYALFNANPQRVSRASNFTDDANVSEHQKPLSWPHLCPSREPLGAVQPHPEEGSEICFILRSSCPSFRSPRHRKSMPGRMGIFPETCTSTEVSGSTPWSTAGPPASSKLTNSNPLSDRPPDCPGMTSSILYCASSIS